MRRGPCVKQTVVATIVTPDGKRFRGTNECYNAQEACPRSGMPTGAGYELCRDICQQPRHAEAAAVLDSVGHDVRGATCYVEGHSYACANCQRTLHAVGVTDIVFGPPPDSAPVSVPPPCASVHTGAQG